MAISRRAFLAGGAAAVSGLVVGIRFVQPATADEQQQKIPWPHASATDFQPNAFLQVTPDNRIIMQLHKQEMGQGVMTGLITIIAEELYTAPERIEHQFAYVHPDFRNPIFNLMLTNASSSITTCYQPIREAAATVRMVLFEAAARQWRVPVGELTCDQAVIYHRASGRQTDFGSLVEVAKTLPLPEKLAFVPASQYRYRGNVNNRLEAPDKVNGKVKYGIDTVVPDALAAAMVYCPQFGGKVKRYDAAKVLKMKGVLDVVETENGIGVVATHYWYAQRGANALKVEWEPGEFGKVSSESIAREQREIIEKAEAESGYTNPQHALIAEYTAPFMAHACMEPMNATVSVTGDRVDVWVSSQAPDVVGATAAHGAGLANEQAVVHSTFVGGGFGRRNIADPHVRDAAQLSKQMGKPVKLILSRENDLRHTWYRPAVTCRMYADLDGDKVTAWRYRLCTPSLNYSLMHAFRSVLFPHSLPKSELAKIAEGAMQDDQENIESALETYYQLGDVKVDQNLKNNGIPVFFWRSVGNSFNGFFMESFIDELAHKAGVDPYQFRMQHLKPDSPPARVLKVVAEKADWGVNQPGRFKGIAFEYIKHAYVAMVAEVSVENDRIRVHRVVCALDAGITINPDIVNTVIESCVIWGMSACLHDSITIKDGAVQQSNFHDFSVVRMNEAPVIEVYQVESDRDPVGVGECAVGPVAPAIANAVFQATGKRLRSLPLKV